MPSAYRALPPDRRALVAVCAVHFVVFGAAFHTMRMDDAFITYRYAENLALGRGMVFNPGERLMGSTAPGHLLLAALLHRLLGHELLPTLMALLGCAAWSAEGAAAYLLIRRYCSAPAAWACAAAVWLGGAGSAEWVPMETHEAVALTLLAVYLGLTSRWYGAAACAALAGLVRPDQLLPALVIAAWGAWEQRGRILGPAALFLALALPWPLFSRLYFGAWVPQSAVTKFHVATLAQYATVIRDNVSSNLLFGSGAAAGACAAVLCGVGGWLLIRRSRRYWPLVLIGPLHFLAYLYLRPFTAHAWHQYPGVLLALTLSTFALASLGETTAGRRVRAIGFAACILLATGYAARAARLARSHRSDYWLGARNQVYREIAGYLRGHARPGDVLAAVEVGTVAYYSDIRVVDMGGLVTSGAARVDGPLQWLMLDRQYVRMAAREPGTPVAFREGPFEAFLFQDPIGHPTPKERTAP